VRLETKPDYKGMAHRLCHPESFASAHPERRREAPKSKDAQDKLREGSLREILRCTQNDMTGWPHRKVSECTEAWFSSPFPPNP
jgi:hypothetical protein